MSYIIKNTNSRTLNCPEKEKNYAKLKFPNCQLWETLFDTLMNWTIRNYVCIRWGINVVIPWELLLDESCWLRCREWDHFLSKKQTLSLTVDLTCRADPLLFQATERLHIVSMLHKTYQRESTDWGRNPGKEKKNNERNVVS